MSSQTEQDRAGPETSCTPPTYRHPLLLSQLQSRQWAQCDIVSACAGCAYGGRGGGPSLPACCGPSSSLACSRLLAVVQGAPGCRIGSKALVHPSWARAVIARVTCCPCCSGKAGIEGRTQTELDSGVTERGRGTGPSLTPGQGDHLGPRMGLRWGRAGFAP